MHQLSNMRLLNIRELAEEKGWTLKEVSDRYGVINSIVRSYTLCSGMTTVDFTAIHRLAHIFDVTIEDLVEIIKE